jgi:MoaA/NifB/PqqE/SkfB family radical SAM enzyme
MGFLSDNYGRDFTGASAEELAALKAENEQRVVKAEEENAGLVDHMPMWLNMTNTTRCNLRCIMCNQAYGKIETHTMEPEVYDIVVSRFYPFLKTVQLSAIGEPMMTPRLHAKIDDMLRYGVKLEMVTNGTLMKGDPLLKRLAEVSELITVSLDGARAETFNSIRTGADFAKIIQSLERFNHFRFKLPESERPHLDFNYILMKRNIRELPDFVDLAADLGARLIICSHLVLYEKTLEEEMLQHHPELSDAFTRAAAERAAARGVEIRLPPPFNAPPEETPLNDPLPDDGIYRGEKCYFLWRRVYIGPHGEVVACCLSGVESLGSLKEEPFPTIWNGKRYRIMRERVHTPRPVPPCDNCYLINRNPASADFRKVD